MFKYIVSAVLCFGPGVACISQEVPEEIELPYFNLHPAMAYAVSGNLHLMLRDFEVALADYHKASICAEQCDTETAEAVEFFVLFGQVVAYDHLHLREKSEQSLGALILRINEDDDEEEFDEEEDDAESIEFHEEFIKMMLRMARLAPSEDIREILVSIIQDEWEES